MCCGMVGKDDRRLKRLQEEHRHTVTLLSSPRLSDETRRVLEALRLDLERQILAMQASV